LELVGARPDLGFLLTPRMGNQFNLLAGPWAADNGCYSAGDAFDLGAYLDFLSCRQHAAATCLFAPAPDVLGDAEATWRRSGPVLEEIRARGFKAALVAQDGLRDPPWDRFDVLFIGGSTEFKLSHHARDLTAAACAHGKNVHMGRVNSETRLRTAAMWGCKSSDGTFLAFAPDTNVPRLTRWLDSIAEQPQMSFA